MLGLPHSWLQPVQTARCWDRCTLLGCSACWCWPQMGSPCPLGLTLQLLKGPESECQRRSC